MFFCTTKEAAKYLGINGNDALISRLVGEVNNELDKRIPYPLQRKTATTIIWGDELAFENEFILRSDFVLFDTIKATLYPSKKHCSNNTGGVTLPSTEYDLYYFIKSCVDTDDDEGSYWGREEVVFAPAPDSKWHENLNTKQALKISYSYELERIKPHWKRWGFMKLKQKIGTL